MSDAKPLTSLRALKIRRIDFSPDEWLAGTAELAEFDRGVYITICALIYSRGERVRVDLLRRHSQAHGNAINASLARLEIAGKIYRLGGEIGQKRSEKELETIQKRLRKASENGTLGNNIKKLHASTRSLDQHANHQLPTNTSSLRSEVFTEATASESKPAKRNGFDAAALMQIFVEECCPPLTRPSKMTEARKRLCLARYADIGTNLGRWRAFCQRVRASPFLTGNSERGWRADFDWLLKEANFIKTAEGKYDPNPQGENGHVGREVSPEEHEAARLQVLREAGICPPD